MNEEKVFEYFQEILDYIRDLNELIQDQVMAIKLIQKEQGYYNNGNVEDEDIEEWLGL